MNKSDLERLSIAELWCLHSSLTKMLAVRIKAEQQKLDTKLELLGLQHPISAERKKRRYPKVHQKYWNPEDHAQTWSGRGRKPEWVSNLLQSGAELNEFIIPQYRESVRGVVRGADGRPMWGSMDGRTLP